jgi:hypothetical protein
MRTTILFYGFPRKTIDINAIHRRVTTNRDRLRFALINLQSDLVEGYRVRGKWHEERRDTSFADTALARGENKLADLERKLSCR